MLSGKHSACSLASSEHAANSGCSHHHQQHHRCLHHHRHHCPKSVLLNQQHTKRVHWRNSHLEGQPEDINSHYLQISQDAYVMMMRWTDEPWRCAVNAQKEGHVFVNDSAEGRQVPAATGDRQSMPSSCTFCDRQVLPGLAAWRQGSAFPLARASPWY